MAQTFAHLHTGVWSCLSVDHSSGASSVFMTVTGKQPGLDGMTFDGAGNVYVTDAHQGIIWKVGPDGGEASARVSSALLKPTRIPPTIGANGLAINNKKTALFVANTANDTIVKIPVNGSTLEPGTSEVFVNRIGGGPDGLLIDEHDNLWIACNQSNEILVLEPTQGRVVAKLGDFEESTATARPSAFSGRTASYSTVTTCLSPTCRSMSRRPFRSWPTSSAWGISWRGICGPLMDRGLAR